MQIYSGNTEWVAFFFFVTGRRPGQNRRSQKRPRFPVQRDLENAKEELELKVARQIDAERSQIREEAKLQLEQSISMCRDLLSLFWHYHPARGNGRRLCGDATC